MRIVKHEPHPSVVKEKVCSNCGVTLEYVPADLKTTYVTDYTGDRDAVKFIKCPNCNHEIHL